jgi:hypothetical protein
LGLTKLAKNGLLNINIYSNCVVADHVAHSRFYVSNSPKEKNRILLDQRSDGKGQSSPLIITQPGNCFRRYCIAGIWEGASSCCHHMSSILREHESLSVQCCNVWFGDTLSCRNFFQQSVCQEQLTSSNQPTNWNNNREKMVMVIHFNRAFLDNSRRFQKCLLKFKNSFISVNIAWKGTRHISKFKLNIVDDTVTYLSVIALLLFKS